MIFQELEARDVTDEDSTHQSVGFDWNAVDFRSDAGRPTGLVAAQRGSGCSVGRRIVEPRGAVDIFNANESGPVNSPLRVQVLGGTRYYAMDASAILSLPNINPVIEIDQGAQWVDLFVGGRAMATLTPGVGAFVRGDVGGFGIGSSSSHAWNIVSGLNLDCICGSHLILAYRVFDIDQSLNGGNGAPQGFGFDGMIHGPVMGMMFQF